MRGSLNENIPFLGVDVQSNSARKERLQEGVHHYSVQTERNVYDM
jgi:hypothetical protein